MSLREHISDLRHMVEAAPEAMPYLTLLTTLTSLKTGDTVEITYADSKNSTKTAKRSVTMSWTEYRDQSSRSDDPGTAFHFKFKAKPSVMLSPSSANKAHLNKPGKGGGVLSDYGDAVMFQATMSTQVKRVSSIRVM